MDKNKELETEVKFYQSRMAGAFAERDKALMEVERLQNSETSLVDEVKEIRKRLVQVKTECSEQEKSYVELEERFETSNAVINKLQKVVDKFWLLRENGGENKDRCEHLSERVQVLLEDEDAIWTYGFMVDPKWREDCKTAELNLARVEEQLVHAEERENTLKLQLEEENLARKLAEERASLYADHLAMVKPRFESDLPQLQVQYRTLVAEVSALLEDEKNQLMLISRTLLNELERRIPEPVCEETGSELREEPETSEVKLEERGPNIHPENETTHAASTSRVLDHQEEEDDRSAHLLTSKDDDSKRVLAQALQEKVEALLLLSQQEERHYLESATKAALENQVTELKQKLAQVTAEKVSALMDVATLRSEVQYLQERERELTELLEQHRSTNAGGRLLPASWSEPKSQVLPDDSSIMPALPEKPVVKTKHPPTASKGYLKAWLRGLDISSPGFRTGSANGSKGVSPPVITSNRQGDDSNSGIARLLVENAALQERLASVQHLGQSAHRLRMTLVKIATDLQGEPDTTSIQAAVDIVETVKTEARRLKVALGCSLPVSFQGPLEKNPEDLYIVPLTEGAEVSEGQTNVALDSVSMAGVEIAELLLATSELQRSSLLSKLDTIKV